MHGSGRQTSAYGEWTSSTISDSGTWVTTGTGVSTDSSTLSLSFSGGVTLGEGGPGVSVSGSHDRASRSTAATAYDDAKGWHTTSGSRTQSGSGSGNVGTTAGYGIVGGSGAGFSYEFSLNSTSGPSGTSSTSGSASATLSWSGTGDTGQTGGGITARARYGDGEGWQIVSVGPATTAGSEGVPGAGDLGTAAAGDDATFSGDESSRQGQAEANAGQARQGNASSGGSASSTLDRVGGVLSIIGGLAQATLGGAVVVGSGIGTVLSGGTAAPVTVATALVGSGVALHGLDEAWAGCRTVWTGSNNRPFAAQALDHVTGNSTASDLINGGIGVAASAGAGSMVRGAAVATRAAANSPKSAAFGIRTLGAAERVPDVLQTGGHTIRDSTRKALGLTPEQAKRAIEGLKDMLLRRASHHQHKILDNGDVRDSHTGDLLGNLFDYL